MAKEQAFVTERVRTEYEERMRVVHHVGEAHQWEGPEANFDMQVMDLSIELNIPHSYLRRAIGETMRANGITRPEAFQKVADGLREASKIPGGTIISGNDASGISVVVMDPECKMVTVRRDVAIAVADGGDVVYLHIPDHNAPIQVFTRDFDNATMMFRNGDRRLFLGTRHSHYSRRFTCQSSIGTRGGPSEIKTV